MNDDVLYVYEGTDGTDNTKLIGAYTGNSKQEFSIMAEGAITFRFVSNDLFREEGWAATIQAVNSMTPQAPYIRRSTCSDAIELESTTLDATIYYTTNGNAPVPEDPLNQTQVYDGTPITWGSGNLTVKAISVLNGVSSAVTTVEFTDADRIPNINQNAYKPGLERVPNTNKVRITCPSVPSGLNETFVVYYTDGITETGDPSPSNYTKKLIFVNSATIDLEPDGDKVLNVHRSSVYEFECTNPSAVFRAKVYGFTCQNLQSPVAGPLTFGDLLVDPPTISFQTTNLTQGTGTATLSCPYEGATIYYTTDGSEPDLDLVGGTNPTQQYSTPFPVSAGTTVKAKAAVNQTGYVASATVSNMFVPTNDDDEPQSGVYDKVVLLDDREDHSWSYYSDGDQPIHSLNPADVKITYYGNGTNTVSTSTNANPGNTFTASTNNSVQVSYNETENQFIYLKTLERANGNAGTGNCAYTTIPNPFSKRPVYGSDNTTKWRGFYGWRVKSVSGGSISGYAVGTTIPAETEVEFVPAAEYGMEVELEALWARAYVVTTGGQNSNTAIGNYSVGYERNFVVLAQNQNYYFGGNTNPRISETGRSATISRRYPDGTLGNANATIRPTGNNNRAITLGADTKFEYMAFYDNNNFTLTAAGHDLIFGRGISGTVNYVRGMSGTSVSDNLDYTIRLESGTCNQLFLTDYNSNGNYTKTYSGTVSVRCVIGCDYDRATNTDTLLHVSPNGEVSAGEFLTMSNSSNKDRLTFDWNVKSGKIQENLLGKGDAEQSMYLTCGTTWQYNGKRRLVVEGGEMANIAGGIDGRTNSNSTDYSTFNTLTAKDKLYLRIRNGNAHVRGAIYGAAAFAGSAGGRTMVITGGQIDSWIAGGCNGTRTTGGELYGDTYIYVGGKANVGNSTGGNHVGGTVRYQTITNGQYYYGQNGADGGSIFGAGCGILTGTYSGSWPNGTFTPNNDYQDDDYSVGRVNNSNVVIADTATIWRDVYGGGNYGYVRANGTGSVSILGGVIKGNVYGGTNNQQSQTVSIVMNDGTVEGNIYGGSNSWGSNNDGATINVSGGTVTNVFGGGYGANTNMNAGTAVNVTGGTINNNVYGGGEQGSVTGNTVVTVSGGTMHNVYGAGLGTEYTGTTWPPAAGNANISGTTTVSVSGGTIANVYGGGENGSVAFASNGATSTNSSTVSVSGGTVGGNVFGGGEEGTTQGRTIVNVSGGTVNGNVFGGAYGVAQRVYVAGKHTVNIMGNEAGDYPFIKGSVYGGSRLANDGKSLTLTHASFDNSSETELSSVVNISGGRVKEHVYAAGYYGRCFGSCYVNIGSMAVQNSPSSYNTSDKAFHTSNVYIQGTVWAGGDWGVFAGEFGKATISGNTNIYIDGEGYDTESTTYTDKDYMGIGGSVLGCGTSCNAGKADRHLVMRNYGKMKEAGATTVNPVTGTTRSLYSAQLFTKVFIDASHITFKGQGKMNELNVTEKYGLYNILDERTDKTGGVYVVNGSTMVLDAPASQINSYNSGTSTNTFVTDPSCTTLGRDALYNAHLNNQDNKVRVNNGSYIEVKYDVKNASGVVTSTLYGPVIGYTHMMTSAKTDEATCAYARPKNAENSPVGSSYDNSTDGGFLSYDDYYNVYTQNGTLVESGGQYELAYENHAPTRSDTEYFRVWRYGGGIHYVEGYVTAKQVGTAGAQGTADYITVDVTVQLPAWRTNTAYYRFDRTGDAGSYFTMIDYGTDVITYNAACYGATPANNNWMYYGTDAQVTDTASTACPEIGKLTENPDQNFGLVIMPGTAMQSANTNDSNYIICSTSDSYIAENMRYNCSNYMKMPTVTFRLTYRNNISSNTTWDPVTIPLKQCLADGTEKETVYITLTINTETGIESTFNQQLYASMVGEGSSARKRLQGTIVLPTFDTDTHPSEAKFYVESAKFTQGVALNSDGSVNQNDTVSYKVNTANMDINSFGLTVAAVPTPDNMDDWHDVQPEFDCAPITSGNTSTWDEQGYLGYAGGRNGLSLGFNLYYSDLPTVQDETLMGTLEIGIKFTHFAEQNGDNIGHFKVIVQVYRRGEGSNFYVDGINGKDDTEAGRGLYPNYAAKTVEFVLSRLGYKPGDNIFIVNTVSINKPLKWDGSKKQDNVNIWRYPGNHALKSGAPAIVGDTLNNAFTGVLFNVNQPLTMTSIKVDGIYNEAIASEHKVKIFPTTPNPSGEGSVIFDGKADAPLFVINDGGALNLRSVSKLLYNYNGNAGADEGATMGGAVWVKDGGLLTMNETANITGNINTNAGGVYMDGGMVVSSYAYVFNNFKAPATAKDGQEQSNVWLTKGTESDMYKVVQIGLVDDEAYNELLTSETANAKIGIDKEYSSDAHMMGNYLPVVYTAESTINYLEEPYNANRNDAGEGIIVHDKAKYKLEKYTPNNYLYWLSTWVTYQDHEPNEDVTGIEGEGSWEGIANIHTPQQLAWFISLVNGENGATANDYAGQTVKITDDISMDGHVWVPIGTPDHPFKGILEGNGHVITDMYGSLVQSNMGMFGYTDNATIQDAVVSTRFTGTNDNLGTVVGTMNGGTLSNVEGAGSILNNYTESNMGGLVGNNVGGTIHSAFAVADMTGGANMGGLVGKNTGDLYNSYSNVDFAKMENQTSSMVVSGFAANNTGNIENCYVVEGTHENSTFYAFAAENTGTINYCYAAEGETPESDPENPDAPVEPETPTYVGSGNAPVGSGTYGA
ncbi:MAG: chitobiase/beta-hexosaminidase C-terminal domain-containing protein, partial [Bacteroidales bacterium]|nr:chitobiase/beta-hexosaminidase C-terminal domain-containing protein [Bacteroidales bacterium]